jgi:hypothetical protein
MAAKKEIAEVAPADLGLSPGDVGAAGSRIEIVSIDFRRPAEADDRGRAEGGRETGQPREARVLS